MIDKWISEQTNSFLNKYAFKIAEFLGIDARPYTFSYGELKTATEDFSSANKLGEGGFGPVFKVSNYINQW